MHKETHGFDAVRFCFCLESDLKMTVFEDGDLSDFAVQ